ncbi:hypothetical protein ACFE04_026555 [Oxalis oulophora]
MQFRTPWSDAVAARGLFSGSYHHSEWSRFMEVFSVVLQAAYLINNMRYDPHFSKVKTTIIFLLIVGGFSFYTSVAAICLRENHGRLDDIVGWLCWSVIKTRLGDLTSLPFHKSIAFPVTSMVWVVTILQDIVLALGVGQLALHRFYSCWRRLFPKPRAMDAGSCGNECSFHKMV